MPFDQVNFVLPAVETDAVLRLLIEGRALLSSAERWTKGAFCRNDSYCMLGAIGARLAQLSDEQMRAGACLRDAMPGNFYPCVTDFNDYPGTSHADVLAVYDRAIAARRAEIGG